MTRKQVEKLLHQVREQQISVSDAIEKLRHLPFQDLGFAKLDHHRTLRRGFPEVVFSQGKTPEQVVEILRNMQIDGAAMATRVEPEVWDHIKDAFPHAQYNAVAKTAVVRSEETTARQATKPVLVCSAGTSDIPVAEEAAVTIETIGHDVERQYDIGVAGLQRVLSQREKLEQANVLVVVAGMDGVLPAVISGLVSRPVIAVPTSVGYGASFQGLAPLLTMMNACSPGVVVVNIDNGFGAGYFAALINK